MAWTKLLLKISENDKEKWVHLCYILTDLYQRYLKEQDYTGNDLNELLSKWCEADFGTKLSMRSSEDIQTLKDLVHKSAKDKYPEIYFEATTDRQGWVRIWVTKHMEEVLNHGEK